MEPRVTVLVPCCREPEALLRAALDSLVRQTVTDWRAILIDDAPHDGGYQRIVASYADPRLSYCRNPGAHGIAPAWNFGVGRVDTEFFSFLHADDELEPDYLETMLALANDRPDASLYACGATVIDGRGRAYLPLGDAVKRLIAPRGAVSVLEGAPALTRLLVGNFLFCPTFLYRTAKVGTRLFDGRYRFVLDLAYSSGVLLDGGRIVLTKHAAYRYRRLAASGTQQYTASGSRFDEELQIGHALAREAQRRGLRAAALAGHASLTVRLHILLRIAAALYARDWKLLRANALRLVR
jgi:glycosyltransferase involved in cell wall biosynthesis